MISKASVTARIPPFQQAFLSQPDGLGSIQEACVFTGPPSPMFGDVPCFDRGGRLDPIVESWGYRVVASHFQYFSMILYHFIYHFIIFYLEFVAALWPDSKEPYRLVREAAEGAREVLETNEFYHQEPVLSCDRY